MSSIHLARQGFITKSALPNVTRQRGGITAEPSLMVYGAGKTTVSNNTTFVDSSTNNFTITRNGDTVQSGFNPFSGVSNGAGFFDGTGDSLSNASANLTTTGDITVEFWVYLSSASGLDVVLNIGNEASARWSFAFNNGAPVLDRSGSGTTTFGSAVSVNVWHHVAFVRSSNTVSCYVNGVSVGTPTSMTGTIGNTSGFYVGAASNSANPFQGYISNLRVVTSVVYTSNFTPPTSPLTAISGTTLLLLMENYSIVNSTSTNYNFTAAGSPVISTAQAPTGMSSSVFLNGTSSLTTPSSSAFAYGTGPYTIEAWVYQVSRGAIAQGIIGHTGPSANVFIQPSGQLGYWTGAFNLTSATLNLNTWYHIAVVRQANNQLNIYVNGTSVYQATNTVNYSTDQGATIGIDQNLLNGYISNARFVKGAALYVTNFTPSAPLSLNITAPNFVSNNIYGVYQLA